MDFLIYIIVPKLGALKWIRKKQDTDKPPNTAHYVFNQATANAILRKHLHQMHAQVLEAGAPRSC